MSEERRGLVVAVTGGRNFDKRARLHRALDRLSDSAEGPIAAIVQGGAPGADFDARTWATYAPGVQCVTFEAAWGREGPAAGPIRNRRMLELLRPDVLLACPGGRGTANCVETAESLGIRVVRLEELL